jgi:hypothetical protein
VEKMFYPFRLNITYLLFAMPALLLALYAQHRVRSAYGKYSRIRNMVGISGLEAARRLLEYSRLYHVNVEGVPGELTDHYDPRTKTLRLSPRVARTNSVASLGIVAHEVGHAVQDATGYLPLKIRTGLVPLASLGSSLGYIVFIIGFLLNLAGLVWLGVALFSGAALFALVTLPVEWDASNRALRMLRSTGLVGIADLEGARKVLSAASLTYIAALAQTISTLLYYVFLAMGLSRRRD